MIKDLDVLGCFPRKSMILDCPSNDQVPEHLFSHFLRGYLGGDGSIRVVRGKIKYVNIVGSYKFIYGISKKISFEHKIYQRHKDRAKEKDSHQLFCLKQKESIGFLNYLYKDSTIHLLRKFTLAQPFLTN